MGLKRNWASILQDFYCRICFRYILLCQCLALCSFPSLISIPSRKRLKLYCIPTSNSFPRTGASAPYYVCNVSLCTVILLNFHFYLFCSWVRCFYALLCLNQCMVPLHFHTAGRWILNIINNGSVSFTFPGKPRLRQRGSVNNRPFHSQQTFWTYFSGRSTSVTNNTQQVLSITGGGSHLWYCAS